MRHSHIEITSATHSQTHAHTCALCLREKKKTRNLSRIILCWLSCICVFFVEEFRAKSTLSESEYVNEIHTDSSVFGIEMRAERYRFSTSTSSHDTVK